MSQVTNLIIVFSTLEEEADIIEQMKKYNYSSAGFTIKSVNDEKLPSGWYGGDKYMECNILIGAYNYLKLSEFMEFLRKEVKWYAPDLVQLMVKEHEDMKFKLIELI